MNDNEKALLVKSVGIWIGSNFKKNKYYYIGLEVTSPDKDGIPTAIFYVVNKSVLIAKYSLSSLYGIVSDITGKKYHIKLKPIFIGCASGVLD